MKPNPGKTPLENLRDAWPDLTPWQRRTLLLRAWRMVLFIRLRALRPVDLILPVMGAQVALFVFTAWLPIGRAIIDMAIGNIVIAGLAMLPVTFVKYHLL